jgi:hypothetical protein
VAKLLETKFSLMNIQYTIFLGVRQIIMSQTELKMQPIIHYNNKIQLYVPNVLWVAFSISTFTKKLKYDDYNVFER